jgi:hypothetical protein
MITKQLVFPAKHTLTAVVCGQNVPRQVQCNGFRTLAILPGLVTSRLFSLFGTKKCSERITGAEQATAKATRALTEESKNGFQEFFQKPYERWHKFVTIHGNCFEGNIV